MAFDHKSTFISGMLQCNEYHRNMTCWMYYFLALCNWYLPFVIIIHLIQISIFDPQSGLILGLHPANERRRYFVMNSLIGWAQILNQPCSVLPVCYYAAYFLWRAFSVTVWQNIPWHQLALCHPFTQCYMCLKYESISLKGKWIPCM